MRVVSGKYKRLLLKGYEEDGIRPTKDSVKESVFAMISPYLDNSVFLDLFAGTGSIGIEGLSNSSKEAYFVDNSKVAIDIIKTNTSKLNISDKIKVINDDYAKALKRFSENNVKFDVIFVDPPYGVIKIERILNKIISSNVLNDNGIIVVEYENELLLDSYEDLELIKERKYGKTYIRVYLNRK